MPCTWEAHGHCYALSARDRRRNPRWANIVANVSRTVIGAMRRAYADVVVVLITAPPNVLAERIAMRARSSDACRKPLAPHGGGCLGRGLT